MIGAYLGTENVFIAVDGEVRASSLESFADTGSVCHVVVPVSFDVRTVADSLAQMQRWKLDVRAFHDVAAFGTAALALSGTTLFIELEEEFSATARVVVSEGVARRQTLLKRNRIGRRALKRIWMELIAESMVLAHRFDPLHDRDSETRLTRLLWTAARSAFEEGSVVVSLPTPRGECSITLTRDQFAVRAAPIYRELSSMLHELRPAASRVDLLVNEADLGLPGFIEMLAEFRGCRVLGLSLESLAIAASKQAIRSAETSDVLLLRGHPVGAAMIQARSVELPQLGAGRVCPTHVLWNAEVKPLTVDSVIEIGRDAPASGLSLPEGLAGVSRWHCSLRVTPLTTELIDHSSHGTWLNEERVLGRVEVFAGDRIRIGDPGIELTLLAIERADGAPAR